MAYWGYLPIVKNHINTFFKDHPNVLEIGLDLGQSFVPMLFYLSKNNPNFSLIGCDVLIKDPLKAILGGCSRDLTETQQLIIVTQSSLEFLPELEKQCNELDKPISVAMIDGDHNYYTVKKELEYCSRIMHKFGIILVDDYQGKYAKKDLYYSDYDTHKDLDGLFDRSQNTSDKQGVGTAVDEFLQENPDWEMSIYLEGHEPCLLYRKGVLNVREF